MCEPDRKQTAASLPTEADDLHEERVERLGRFARVMRKEAQRLQDQAVFLSRHADHLEKKAARVQQDEPDAPEEDIPADDQRPVTARDRETPAPPDRSGNGSGGGGGASLNGAT